MKLTTSLLVKADTSIPVIRNVTTTTRDRDLTIFYHLALVGLAKPIQVWGKAYILTVPDSVTEVEFGKTTDTVWKRDQR